MGLGFWGPAFGMGSSLRVQGSGDRVFGLEFRG